MKRALTLVATLAAIALPIGSSAAAQSAQKTSSPNTKSCELKALTGTSRSSGSITPDGAKATLRIKLRAYITETCEKEGHLGEWEVIVGHNYKNGTFGRVIQPIKYYKGKVIDIVLKNQLGVGVIFRYALNDHSTGLLHGFFRHGHDLTIHIK